MIFYEIARRRGWLERYPRYIAALNWINLPAVILLLVGEFGGGARAADGRAALLQIGLQILFFYWFMMATRLALGVTWLLAARADGRELGAVLLPVNSRQSLPRRQLRA